MIVISKIMSNTSEKQQAANRENGKLGGVKTELGKKKIKV